MARTTTLSKTKINRKWRLIKTRALDLILVILYSQVVKVVETVWIKGTAKMIKKKEKGIGFVSDVLFVNNYVDLPYYNKKKKSTWPF